LERMTDWLRDHFKPDVIHLSNALLSGLAKTLKEKLNSPVVCSLQDEDVWVDVMTDANRQKVWDLMSENAGYIDRFISVSEYFKTVALERMSIPSEKISTIHIGVDPSDYQYINSTDKMRTIGYISRMCPENGLDILTDAFVLLKRHKGYDDVKLIITGGQTGDDKVFLKQIRKTLDKNGVADDVEFYKEFEGDGRKQFFARTSMISVPVRNGEAFGIYIAESLASGIPVIQPALGAFPEILQKAGGGVIYGENTPEELAAALKEMLDNPERLQQLSKDARQGAEEHLDIHKLARHLIGTYEQVSRRN